MALVTGLQEVTSSERATQTFSFQGGGIGYMVTGAPNTAPYWDLEIQLPDDTWIRVHAASKQVDSAKPFDMLRRVCWHVSVTM